MEGSLPLTTTFQSVQSTSKTSLVLTFLSCLAWLYAAGRLWQDTENRKLLENLLKKNSNQRPKVLTVEDKLVAYGCKDLEQRIVEAEMELTLAKSQGYLKNQVQPSSGKKLFAVIGIYTGFGGRLQRNVIRGSWMSEVLTEGLDEESEEELPKKAKLFFSAAVQMWDAEFYVKVDDNVVLKLDELIELIQSRRGQDSAYIGCMKSGEVVAEEGKQWYEPKWWKFGDQKSYFRHAADSIFILTKNLAKYIHINSASLKVYAHEDVSVGSWMMGLRATYIDDSQFVL